MKRHLILKSEHLTELTPGDLAAVNGAATTSDLFTGYYPSINAYCTTLLTPVCPLTGATA